MVTNNKFGSKSFYIYARAYFVNETPFDFFYFCQVKDERIKDDRYKFLPGQKVVGLEEAEEFGEDAKKVTLLGAHTSFMIDFNVNFRGRAVFLFKSNLFCYNNQFRNNQYIKQINKLMQKKK